MTILGLAQDSQAKLRFEKTGPVRRAGCEKGAVVRRLMRRRQTKGAVTRLAVQLMPSIRFKPKGLCENEPAQPRSLHLLINYFSDCLKKASSLPNGIRFTRS